MKTPDPVDPYFVLLALSVPVFLAVVVVVKALLLVWEIYSG